MSIFTCCWTDHSNGCMRSIMDQRHKDELDKLEESGGEVAVFKRFCELSDALHVEFGYLYPVPLGRSTKPHSCCTFCGEKDFDPLRGSCKQCHADLKAGRNAGSKECLAARVAR